ncbi:MAG TPA: hypothetical protein PK967_14975 [Candidatus Hydrogenedentes bacterium]|nr:hypothetical protein [Candidatus Hydrogenedentota bacterium]
MSQPAAEPAVARKPRRWLKWIVRSLLAVVGTVAAILIVAGLLLASGWPQRRLLENELGKALKADVKAGGLSIWNPLRIADLKAFDKTPGGDSQTPMIALEKFSLAYTLFPEDGRYFPSLSVDRLSINIDRSREAFTAPEAPAAPAAKPGPKPSKSKRGRGKIDTSKLLPKTVNLARLDVGYSLPYMGVSLGGFGIKGDIESRRNYSVQIQGSQMNGFFWAGGRAAQRDFTDAAIDLRYENKDKGTRIEPLKIVLPGLIEIEGGASVGKSGDKTMVDIHFEKGLAQNIDMSQSASGKIPFPFRFKKVDMSGTAIRGFGAAKGLNVKVSFDGTNISVAGEDLAIGPKDHEYYEGNLSLQGKGGGGEQLQLDLEATLNRGQKIAASMNGTEVADMKARVEIKDWSRDDLVAALPKDARAAMDSLPGFHGLSGAVDLQFEKNLTYTLNARVAPRWIGPNGEPADVSFTFNSTAPLLRLAFDKGMDGTLSAQIGDQSVAATVRAGMGRGTTPFRVEYKASLDQLDPRAVAATLAGSDVLAALDARLNGTAELTAIPSSQTYKAAMDLSAAPFRYGALRAPEGQALSIKGVINANNTPYWNVDGPSLEVRLGENASLVLKDYSADFSTFEVGADVAGEFDLALLPSLGLSGRVKLTAPVENKNGVTTATLDVKVEGFGYAGSALPTTATLAGAIQFDNIKSKGTVENLQASLGAGTVLSCPKAEFTSSPWGFTAPWTFQTDFQSLVAMGLLDEAKGTAAAACTAACAEGRCTNKIEFTTDAETLSFGGGTVAIQGLTLKTAGEWSCTDGLAATGDVQAAQLAIAGVAAGDVKGPVAIEGDTIKFNGLQGTMFGGGVAADIAFAVLREGRPLTVKAQFTGADLGLLSKTLPVLNLSGKGSGSLTVESDASGLKDCRIDAVSDGPVSVSTSALKALLASQFAKMAGNKPVDRIVGELLGKEGERPFDGAKLTLAYTPDGFVGQITLSSDKMDLTIDLNIEPGAIADGIKLLQ